jgi:hypothetical protein
VSDVTGRRVACGTLHRARARDDVELVVVRETGRTFLLQTSLVELITGCLPFLTAEDHARAAAARLGAPADGIPKLAALIGELAAEGLLVDLDEARSCARPSELAPLARLGVVTSGRPDSVARAVASYLGHARRFGRSLEVLVCDDTRDPAVLGETRRRLHELSAGVQHFGPDEKRAFANDLARESGVDPTIVEFALFDPMACGTPIGANRNALMLLTAGERLLSADDDTVCRAIRAPDGQDRIGFLEGDPQEHWFFPDAAAALALGEAEEVDVFSEHERLLGRAIVDLLDSVPLASGDLRGICAAKRAARRCRLRNRSEGADDERRAGCTTVSGRA